MYASRYVVMTLLTQLLVFAAVSAAQSPSVPEPSTTAKMTFEAGETEPILTRSRIVSGGIAFKFNDDSGQISINGEPMKIAARYKPSKESPKDYISVGFDTNRDRTIGEDEHVQTKDLSCVFNFKGIGDRQCQAILNLSKPSLFRDPSGAIKFKPFAGAYYPNYSMKGTIAGQAIRLIDENMDGVFTQDGKDCIVIGDSIYGLPLYRTHMIAGKQYQLQVVSDGSSLDFSPAGSLKVGLVETPLLTASVKAIVIADHANGRAYDLVSAGKAGIPEGTYEFCYSVVSSGTACLFGVPTPAGKVAGNAGTPKYPITADMINVLSLGPPFRLCFQGIAANNRLMAMPGANFGMVGAGNEFYALIYQKGQTPPSVCLYNGDKLLSKESMKYG